MQISLSFFFCYFCILYTLSLLIIHIIVNLVLEVARGKGILCWYKAPILIVLWSWSCCTYKIVHVIHLNTTRLKSDLISTIKWRPKVILFHLNWSASVKLLLGILLRMSTTATAISSISHKFKIFHFRLIQFYKIINYLSRKIFRLIYTL